MVEKFRRAFTNITAKSHCADKNQLGVIKSSALHELPVILMLLEVTANAGQKIGTLIDLASDTNYITHRAARRLNLCSEKITLVVHGVGGMAMKVKTKRYLLRVRVKTPTGTERAHQLVCYGLDEIANVHRAIRPEQLKKFFPETSLEDLTRPKHIELLISHHEGRLAPQRVKVIGDLVLWEGPLGKTVGGAHPNLFEEVDMAAHTSKTHFARSMRTTAVKYQELTETQEFKAETKNTVAGREFLDWWRWDSIGAACEPKCGGCRCGNCQPGGKEMTLSEERELEIIRKGLTYVKADAHSSEPHWDTKYPWIEDPVSLPDNRSAVEATFLRTEKQLKKEPEWRVAYGAQVHEMVERGAAKKLTKDIIANWKGPVWYVSHLVAPNSHSVTTPVRLVWNSSQKFKGISMNDLLLKEPDVLNPIRAVLLRFRRGVHAALSDIKKMYNSVWLEDLEMHLHRLLWRDTEDGEIEEYAITRDNIGDRPAGCIAQLAMRETAMLPMFAHLEEERRILEEDSYVDDVLTSHNDLEKLDENTKKVEEILKAGGFFLKPWIQSGQSRRQEHESGKPGALSDRVLILPNQMREGDNKALGVGYLVENDKLYPMTSINFSKRKKKMRVGQNLLEEEVRGKTPSPLTRRQLLSQVASLYDPIGLVTPAKQKGAILVRKAFQEASGSLTRDTWDKPLSEKLREEAIQVFKEYIRLSQITFHRSLTPGNWIRKPWGVTFSDGSDQSYGAVVYLRWETTQGIEVRLVESKAKLTPLDQKGEPVKAETCGVVFAVRLRRYIEKHSRMEIEQWLHLLDSQTVLAAIQRDSYGYQTFFANRVGEIQKSTSADDWWWIPGDLNVADILTRGAAPEDFQENSVWQNGPEFLKQPVEQWPKKSAKEVAAYAKEGIDRLQRKSFSAALTRSQVKNNKGGVSAGPSSPVTAQEAHNANHEEIAGTLLRMRKTAWVIKGRKLAQKIVDNCVTCRKARARKCQQIMSDLPPERITPARPFEYTTVDLFGPYEVKDETPVGARPALKELYLFLDQLGNSGIENEATKHGTEWSWKFHPADSPHRNGTAEAAVRTVKRALHNLGGDGCFTWSEFQTFLYMASNLANERPIDARTQSQEDCVDYISLNSLLLGRAGPRGDLGSFEFEGYPYKRLRAIQTEVDQFWRKWSQLAGPNLYIRSKWHTAHRNVAVGDVIWLADQNALRGQYKLARVISVNTDKKGIVRDVHVRTFPSYPVPTVKPDKKEKSKKLKIPATVLHRDVRRIIVLLPAEEQEKSHQD
ncbi:hypothetical protein PHYPO_G00234660 [Pangasianodon hypophthalmus]|uniref:Integrase catalytic domain-containing protein n=1 Tax=Pangasianodon hypophthalmus TaxID=310915 RepID=A0A5N5NK01_PANHP|nr:hypothetical protein PHYPO_G00234660 [Pangasianodon hypophthalmus]